MAAAGLGPGRRGRRPQLWRYHTLHYRVEAFTYPKKRTRRGRPPQGEQPQAEVRYRLVVNAAAEQRATEDNGWTVLATTVGVEECSDTAVLQAYHEQHITVEPGFRCIKNPAAITPVWMQKPERIAVLAMLTVVGLLVYALIQRQVRRSLHTYRQHIPGNKGPTALPTAAVVLSLFDQVMMVHLQVDNTEVLQVYGLQEHHGRICDALGVDRSWYGAPSTRQNHPINPTPP